MAREHVFALTLLDTGRVLDCYDRYELALDMTRPGNAWAFTFWRSGELAEDTGRRRTVWRVLLDEVKVGGQILFAIDAAPQLNGRIEEFKLEADRQSGARITISGRDLAGLAIDWDADPRISIRNGPLDVVLREAFNRVGIQAVVGVGADAEREVRSRVRRGARGSTRATSSRKHRVDYSRPRPGERVWEFCESIVKRLGYRMWVAPSADGVNQMAVVVDTPAYDTAPVFQLRRREVDGEVDAASNILSSSFEFQVRDVPTIVYAAGRAARGDTKPARHRVAYTNDELARVGRGRIADPLPPQPRHLHTARARNPATAQQEARRVLADAMQHCRVYTCTVQGHGQDVGGAPRLFTINTMAHVYDRVGDYTLLDEDMLIQRVQFSGSRQTGQTTQLTLGTKGAIALTPTPE